MKKIFLMSLITFSLIVFISHVSALTCNVIPTSQTCGGIPVFKMSGGTNALVEKADQTHYNYQVCCQEPGIILGTSCSGTNGVLRLSGSTNAHVERNTFVNPGYNGNDVCLSAPSGDVTCNIGLNGCESLNDPKYTCVVSISYTTNAHVGDCSPFGSTTSYARRVCCKYESSGVTTTTTVTGTTTTTTGITTTSTTTTITGTTTTTTITGTTTTTTIGPNWPHVSISAPSSKNVNEEFDVTLTYTHDTSRQGGIHLRWLDTKFDIVNKAGCDSEYIKDPSFAPGWEGIECSNPILSSGTTKTFRLKTTSEIGANLLYYRAWELGTLDHNCGTWSDFGRDPNSGTCSEDCHQWSDDWEVCNANERSVSVLGGATTTTTTTITGTTTTTTSGPTTTTTTTGTCSDWTINGCQVCTLNVPGCDWCESKKTCYPDSSCNTDCGQTCIINRWECPTVTTTTTSGPTTTTTRITTTTTTAGPTTTTTTTTVTGTTTTTTGITTTSTTTTITGTTTTTTVSSNTLTVISNIDVFEPIGSLPNVQITVDGTSKTTSSDSTTTFNLATGSHSITAQASVDGRPFSHFYDNDCDSNNPNYWLDTSNNPYAFSKFGRSKTITAQYKVFTKIIDLNYAGNSITGKLLDERNNILIGQGGYHPTCTPEPTYSVVNVDRNVKLEYYDGSWHLIDNVDSSTASGFSKTWSCVTGATKIRVSYNPSNWYYVGSSTEIGVCGGTTTTITGTTTTVTGVTTTTTSVTTTTTTIADCSYDNPCIVDIGKTKVNQIASDQKYYMFELGTPSNVTVRLQPTSNVDYDLYVNWDGEKPTTSEYDCKSFKETGLKDECKNSGLFEGTYYIMAEYKSEYSQGNGLFNLSVSATPIDSAIIGCSNQEKPCRIDCGKDKTNRSTSNEEYFKFTLTSRSNVMVRLQPTSNVDYDLYVNWDEEKPTTSEYDCRPSNGRGEKEECKTQDTSTLLEPGTYYIMVDFADGFGKYDLSLICSPIRTTTTSTTSTTTTGLTTTTTSGVTTTRITTTSIEEATCGDNGYCTSDEEVCSESYAPCSNNDGDCYGNEICCCPKGVSKGLWQIMIGLMLAVVLVVLVYFYLKSKSRLTYEKLYQKWGRMLIEVPSI